MFIRYLYIFIYLYILYRYLQLAVLPVEKQIFKKQKKKHQIKFSAMQKAHKVNLNMKQKCSIKSKY